MKTKSIVFVRKSDFLILGILLIASLLCLRFLFRSPGNTAQITLDHRMIAEISLSESREAFTVAGINDFQFTVADGAISVISAPCDNQICVHSGAVSSTGQRIICLPSRMMIVIIDKQDDIVPDAVL